MSPLLLLKILSPHQIHQLALTLPPPPPPPPRSRVQPRMLDLLSGSLFSSSSSFPLCARTPSLLSVVSEGFSVHFSPSVSLSASSSLLRVPAPNDFYPLSDLSSPSRGLLRFFTLVFRQLVLPLHLSSSSSSCTTALSTLPVSPSLMRVPVSLCANWRCPSPPLCLSAAAEPHSYSAMRDCCVHGCKGLCAAEENSST